MSTRAGRRWNFRLLTNFFGTSMPHCTSCSYTACHDGALPMMLLDLMAAVIGALKWQDTPTQGKEEVWCGIGSSKNSISRFILCIPQELAFHNILANVVTL
jgi:hypothetical protein